MTNTKGVKKFSKEYYRAQRRIAGNFTRIGLVFAGILAFSYDFETNTFHSYDEKSYVAITLCAMCACVFIAMYFLIQSHPETNLDTHQPQNPE